MFFNCLGSESNLVYLSLQNVETIFSVFLFWYDSTMCLCCVVSVICYVCV